jgi:hypothetical protein
MSSTESSELRKRNVSKKDGTGSEFEERAGKYVDALSQSAPDKFKPYLEKAKPIITKAAGAFERALPVLQKTYDKAMELKVKTAPYRLDLLIPSFLGLIMCFFGGSYMTVIAAVEAYKLVGWESSHRCIVSLCEDFQALRAANEKDDSVDADGNGVSDVNELAAQQLLQRKVLLFLKTVDPKRFNDAISGLNAGFLAVVATLKLQFAKAITLGNAIGEILEKPANAYLLPVLQKMLPEDQKKWAAPLISYFCRSAAVSIAWTLQRIISAFHSALRGGVMCSRNILEYLSVMNIYHLDHEKTMLDEIAGYGLALLGLWFQLSTGFKIPFPLNVLLLPFTIAEWFLMYFIAK